MGSFIDITCVVSRLFTGIIINSINYYDWIVYIYLFFFFFFFALCKVMKLGCYNSVLLNYLMDVMAAHLQGLCSCHKSAML